MQRKPRRETGGAFFIVVSLVRKCHLGPRHLVFELGLQESKKVHR